MRKNSLLAKLRSWKKLLVNTDLRLKDLDKINYKAENMKRALCGETKNAELVWQKKLEVDFNLTTLVELDKLLWNSMLNGIRKGPMTNTMYPHKYLYFHRHLCDVPTCINRRFYAFFPVFIVRFIGLSWLFNSLLNQQVRERKELKNSKEKRININLPPDLFPNIHRAQKKKNINY